MNGSDRGLRERVSHDMRHGVPPRRGYYGRGGGRDFYLSAPPSGGRRRRSSADCGRSPQGRGPRWSGVPVGRDIRTGATVCSDPVNWFRRAGLIANPSMVVLGIPGVGKSKLVGRIATGLASQGVDPIIPGDLKPDHADMTLALGRPGGAARPGPGVPQRPGPRARPWPPPSG